MGASSLPLSLAVKRLGTHPGMNRSGAGSWVVSGGGKGWFLGSPELSYPLSGITFKTVWLEDQWEETEVEARAKAHTGRNRERWA